MPRKVASACGVMGRDNWIIMTEWEGLMPRRSGLDNLVIMAERERGRAVLSSRRRRGNDFSLHIEPFCRRFGRLWRDESKRPFQKRLTPRLRRSAIRLARTIAAFDADGDVTLSCLDG